MRSLGNDIVLRSMVFTQNVGFVMFYASCFVWIHAALLFFCFQIEILHEYMSDMISSNHFGTNGFCHLLVVYLWHPNLVNRFFTHTGSKSSKFDILLRKSLLTRAVCHDMINLEQTSLKPN